MLKEFSKNITALKANPDRFSSCELKRNETMTNMINYILGVIITNLNFEEHVSHLVCIEASQNRDALARVSNNMKNV